MARLSNKYNWLLFVAIAVSVVGVVNLSERPVPPFQYHQTPDGIRIKPAVQSSRAKSSQNDHLVYMVDEVVVEDVRQITAILEGKTAGDSIQLVFMDGITKRVYLPGAGFHWTLIIYILLGLSFYVIAFLVWQHASHTGEKYFGYAAILFGVSIILNSTGLHLPLVLAIPITVIYFFCYLFAFIMFHYFSYYFPDKVLSDGLLRIRRNYLIGGGIVVSVILTISYLTKTFSPSVQNVVFHDYIYRGFRAMIVLLFIISLNILFRNLHFDPNPKNYLKVYWLIWGIIFGSAPFLLFWNIPQLFGYQPLVPEWLVTLWLIIIPVSIAISIIKYRLFDIEIILSRSIVYFAVIAILLVFYIVLVGGLSLVVNQQFSLQSPVFSLFTAVGIGLVFNPLKERVTHVIDRKFFRIRYDRFLALKRFLNTSEKCYTQKMVLLVLREQYHSVVPLRHSFFAMLETNKWRFLPKMAEDCEKWYNVLNDALFFNKKEIVINESHQSLVEDLEGKIIHLLPDKGVVLVPVGSAVFWCLGKKLSGARFWKEDMELAEQMAQAAAIQLEKVHYFQRSVEEAMEKERAQQLSRWKTLLVAEVAHDLRSPLNTILWKLRNLQQTLQEQEESRLQPMVDIRGQIEHLQALIQTLLILPRVEEGKYRVQWQMLPLKCVVAEVLSHLEGIISGKGLQVTVDCPADLTLRADLTLLKEILLNLLDNAAKFSPPGKNIIVRAFPETSGKKERVRIIISDEAGGIPPGQQRLIFEPFHEGEKEGGRIHLGLYIAREFTRLMGGELQLRSEYGKGTEVELCFEK